VFFVVGVDPGKAASGVVVEAVPLPYGGTRMIFADDVPSTGRAIADALDVILGRAARVLLELALPGVPVVIVAVELQWSSDPLDKAHGSKVAGAIACAATRGRWAGEAERRGLRVVEVQAGQWRRGIGLPANTPRATAKAAALSAMRARVASAADWKTKRLTDHVAEAAALAEYVAIEERTQHSAQRARR